jgi:hypothetical protein
MNTSVYTQEERNEIQARWEEFYRKRDQILNINNYINDGFEKVCDVMNHGVDWVYKNINKDLMYSNHSSWVYFIVENETIVKCGETGNPLGIRESYASMMYEVQPVGHSKCRFGRLRKGDGTDAYIRRELRKSINAGNTVSLWAKKCKIHVLNESLGGQTRLVETTIHKSVELLYLEHFKDQAGRLPLLNKASK